MSAIWTMGIGSSEGLSALIVGFLWAFTLFFLLFTFEKYISAKKHIKFYENLIKGLTPEQLFEKQREIRNKALENKEHGYLWREFDETLVSMPERRRLCNTYDAGHFFNTYSLARGLAENRLLAAVPGFLTAVGVIGTFAGLQMGLRSMHLADGDLASLQQGIFTMIDGASVAFITSVWGITSSLLFNIIEKSLERSIRSKIGGLQNQIDFLYPRITAEHSLVNIEGLNKEATASLQGLAEKIGNQMQQVMTVASDNIRIGLEQSLESIMAPAIESLVENANQGSEKALDSMLNRFMDGIGEAGEKQREMMQSTTEEMQSAIQGMGTQITDFSNDMQKQSADQKEQHETQVRKLTAYQSAQQKKMGDEFQKMVNGSRDVVSELTGKLLEQVESQSERDVTRNEKFMGDVNGMLASTQQTFDAMSKQMLNQLAEQEKRDQLRSENVEKLLSNAVSDQRELAKTIGDVIETQKMAQSSVKQQLDELLESFKQVGDRNSEIIGSINTVTSSLSEATSKLDTLSVTIGASVSQLGDQTAEIASEMKVMIEHTSSLGEGLNNVSETINGLVKGMSSTASTMNEASTQAEKGFTAVNQHFSEVAKSLKEHIREVEDQVASLLTSYASQVQVQVGERMNEWNVQTNQYISSMTDAVVAIGSVVDEIETKVGTN